MGTSSSQRDKKSARERSDQITMLAFAENIEGLGAVSSLGPNVLRKKIEQTAKQLGIPVEEVSTTVHHRLAKLHDRSK